MKNGQEPDRIGGIDEALLNAYIDGELEAAFVSAREEIASVMRRLPCPAPEMVPLTCSGMRVSGSR